jgi:hypothetical protein
VSGLVIASVLVALGDGFRSGADQALLYRTCLALHCEDDFQKIEARAEAVALGALVLLVLLGGVIVQVGGFAMGWFAETMLCFLGFAIACAMVEPPAPADRKGEHGSRHDGTPIRYSWLALSVMPAALLGGAASATSFLAQTTGAKSPTNVTVIVAALAAAEASGSALASRLPPARPRDQIRLAAFGSILLMIAMALPATLPLIALALGFLVGVAQPLRAAAIQRLAADSIRARAASAASACDMAVSTIVLPWRVTGGAVGDDHEAAGLGFPVASD